ncbi:MAG: hypothetical protein HC853_03530 [Anaerolineae bacterium]|nr:hypothetical protein [Anaerolineae bacterium]
MIMTSSRFSLPFTLVVVASVLIGLWVAYNLRFAPPPSNDWIQDRVVSISFDTEQSSKGRVSKILSKDKTRLFAVKNLSWGTVALYKDDQFAGFASFLRHFDGWQTDNYLSIPTSSLMPLKTASIRHDIVMNRVIDKSANVIWGKRDNPSVSIIKITFDDGAVVEQPITETWFAVIEDGHGAAREMQLLDGTSNVLETVKLDQYQGRF